MTERLVGRQASEPAWRPCSTARARRRGRARPAERARRGSARRALAAAVAAERRAARAARDGDAGRTPPYGPLVAALRSRLRVQPDALDGVGPLRAQLALLLPELGEPAAAADRATLFEALRAASPTRRRRAPASCCSTTSSGPTRRRSRCSPALAEPLGGAAAARPRRLPLGRPAAQPRPAPAAQRPAARGHARGARARPARGGGDGGAARGRARGAAGPGAGAPRSTPARRGSRSSPRSWPRRSAAATRRTRLPDTVRDAVLVAAAELSPTGARRPRWRPSPARGSRPSAWRRWPATPGSASCSSAGWSSRARRARPASATRWPARRSTPTCPGRGGARCTARSPRRWSVRARTAARSAEHWLGAREPERARAALLRAASRVRGPARLPRRGAGGRRALELWPPGADAGRRAEVLERYARCCQPAGDLRRGRQGVARARRPPHGRRRGRAVAHAQRGLAAALELAGERDAALAARTAAAEAFAADGLARARPRSSGWRSPTSAGCRRSSGRRSPWPAPRAPTPTPRAGWTCSCARWGSRAWRRPSTTTTTPASRRSARALALALEHDLTAVAAELYQRLSMTLYEAAELPPAEAALDTALGAVPREPGRRHGGRVRDVHGLRAARARRVGAAPPS